MSVVEEDVEDFAVEYTVAFVLIATLLGSLLDFSLNLVPARIRRKLPPSTGLYFIIGLAIAAVVDGGNYAGFIDAIENLDPDVVLYALLPPLLANFSLHMDMQVFRKVLPQAIFLASAGVIFQILLIGFFFSLVFTAYGWTFIQGMLLGSMLAATDPVAVISILHELGAPKRISTILEGESLLNDGSAFVLFLLIKDASTGRISSFWDVLLRFCDLTLGGPAWGIVMAGIGHFWLSLCHNHTTIETFIPLIGSFATFYSAEKLGVSGVLATVVFGLYMGAKGKYSISPESAKSVDHVLDEVSYLCNMLLFILAGVIVFFHIDDTVGSEAAWVLWIYLIAMYFLLFVFRGLMFVVFSPLLKKWGYGMTTKEAVLLTHAGMRGAISLSLGLLLVKDAEFYAEYPDFAHAVNFLVSGTVCLTLVINGATVDFVYSALELYPPNPHRGTIFQNTMDLLENESMPVVIRKLRTSDHFFQLSNWKAVKKILPKFSTTMLDGVELLWPEGGDTDVIDVLESMITRKGVFNVELEGEYDGISEWDKVFLQFKPNNNNNNNNDKDNTTTTTKADQSATADQKTVKVQSAISSDDDSDVEEDTVHVKVVPRKVTHNLADANVRRVAVFEGLFNALKATYKTQFHERHLSNHAIGALTHAANAGLSAFETGFPTSDVGALEEKDVIKISTNSDVLLSDYAQDRAIFELAMPFQMEFTALETMISAESNSFTTWFAQVPGFSFVAGWSHFRTVAHAIEVAIGYVRAHREVGKNLLSKLDETEQPIAQFNKQAITQAEASLKALEAKFPQIFEVVITVLTARVLCRKLSEECDLLHKKGYITTTEEEALQHVIFSKLRALDRYLDSPTIGKKIAQTTNIPSSSEQSD